MVAHGQPQPCPTEGHCKVSCSALPELYGYMAWVREACNQTGANFPSRFAQLPSTCASPGCAAAVQRFNLDCGDLLASDHTFATHLEELGVARGACALRNSTAAEYAVQSSPPVITSCSGTLTDGAGN